MTARDHDVVVLGGGLAGLTCALELQRAEVGCRIVEAADQVGGRVRTDEVHGFRLDRGFQVLLTAYPEARRLLDYGALDLRTFFPGALVRSGGRFRRLADPWRRPLQAVAGLLDGTVPIADALRTARLRSRVRRGALDDIWRRPDRSTSQRLVQEGFSTAFIEGFLRPFFAGVMLDPELSTSDRQLEFVYRMFSEGPIAVPARGMGEIPRQLVDRLPEGSVTTGLRVASVAPDRIETTDGDRIEAAAVVVATDAGSAHELLGSTRSPGWKGVRCLYFAAERPPLRGPYLVLDGEGEGPVNNLCVPSEVTPQVAPAGASLVSATVLGTGAEPDDELEAAVRSQLRGWFGTQIDAWQLLTAYHIPRALPLQLPHSGAPGPRPPRVAPGLFLCGDHHADASINGAMASGRAAAMAVRDHLE